MSPAVCAVREEHSLLPLHRPHCASGAAAEPIMIFLTAPGLAAMPMRVMASDSIAAVKLRVQTSRPGVQKTSRAVRLVFDGRELARDDCRVRDYGVGDGNVLHLVIRIADLRLIVVETVHGSKFRFRVEPGRTVGYVKQRIARDRLHRPAAHPDDQTTLVLEGEELDDRHLIHDVCKADGAVIHLLVQRSAANVSVARDFEVSIVARDAAGDDALRSQPQVVTKDVGIEPVVVNPKAQLPPALRDLVGAVLAGMENGNAPIMSSEGTGGAYFMQDASGEHHVAVFKPVDEEPMAANNPRGLPVSSTGEGLKKGTRVGEGAFREVAAYLLDHPLGGRRSFAGHGAAAGFAGVPPTALVRCMDRSFRQADDDGSPVFKLGSMQAFVKNCGSCEDMGPRAFPVQEVHKISVLDMRLANADRHAGNILVCKDEAGRGGMSLVPIDHGYCLPESFEDCTFEWLYWPQSREPFNAETVKYIASLDAEEDISILKFHGWEISSEVARTLRVTTILLKKGTERGLTAFDIGSMLCRETLTKESAIEEMVREAQDGAADEDAFLQAVSEIMDRRFDQISSDRK
ncbi:hypothetical protein EJB05_52589 [Eragrostis curvula]|uniref:1-phosphatidylinositol 4-kinase n=1 Tax=Eragrostis curvula TaxID=38414 RepID=A0A5J9SJ38_9POAL|nr:hypothetical protein EJB05_55622 [Eragrostis curvula]TVU01940.1 hypothetical protein EJB05_52589 [Eragrostis curvula]